MPEARADPCQSPQSGRVEGNSQRRPTGEQVQHGPDLWIHERFRDLTARAGRLEGQVTTLRESRATMIGEIRSLQLADQRSAARIQQLESQASASSSGSLSTFRQRPRRTSPTLPAAETVPNATEYLDNKNRPVLYCTRESCRRYFPQSQHNGYCCSNCENGLPSHTPRCVGQLRDILLANPGLPERHE